VGDHVGEQLRSPAGSACRYGPPLDLAPHRSDRGAFAQRLDRRGVVVIARVAQPGVPDVHFIDEFGPPGGLPEEEDRIDAAEQISISNGAVSLDGVGRRGVSAVGDHREPSARPVDGPFLEEEQHGPERAEIHLVGPVGREPSVVAQDRQVRPHVAICGEF
jgi:hypothetical protein